jgi:hypothetical protein
MLKSGEQFVTYADDPTDISHLQFFTEEEQAAWKKECAEQGRFGNFRLPKAEAPKPETSPDRNPANAA